MESIGMAGDKEKELLYIEKPVPYLYDRS